MKTDGYWILSDALGATNLHNECKSIYLEIAKPGYGNGVKKTRILMLVVYGILTLLYNIFILYVVCGILRNHFLKIPDLYLFVKHFTLASLLTGEFSTIAKSVYILAKLCVMPVLFIIMLSGWLRQILELIKNLARLRSKKIFHL